MRTEPAPEAFVEFAPAKVNLTLQVTARRPDGYHLLDSLVVFAEVGDLVTVRPAADLTLRITGPQAASLPVADDNLVLRAARLMWASAEIELEKHLPASSGIGGGSSDAAATLRALAKMRGETLPHPSAILGLGADVPVCLDGKPSRMSGLGEVLRPLPRLPKAWLVLANPGIAVATSAVFRDLARVDNPRMPEVLPTFQDFASFAAFLRTQRNDLEGPALTLAPTIAEVKSLIAAQAGCHLARMSGSGATCFGLFATSDAAKAAAEAIRSARPSWWVAAAQIRD
jgi:4-diphosphocytidyl-2-C-methyl-D-erythritol kinase